MAWQLIYTSAPRLLEAGRSGFGTVARHRQISPLLVSTIERASQFARMPGLDTGRVIYCHRIVAVAGGRFHVLSCIRDAGADYTGRTNHLAHHLVAEQREVAALGRRGASPADVLLGMSWVGAWDEAPRFLETADEIALADFGAQAAGHWEQTTGDGQNAWLLANGEASRGAYILYPPGTDPRGLFAESLRLTPDRLWQVPFTTALQPSDEPSDFRWIALEADSSLRAQAASSSRPVLDLTRPETLPAPEVPANAAIAGLPRPTALGSAPREAALPQTRTPSAKSAPTFSPQKQRGRKWLIAGSAGVLLAAIGFAVIRPRIAAEEGVRNRREDLKKRVAASRIFSAQTAESISGLKAEKLSPADQILGEVEKAIDALKTVRFDKMRDCKTGDGLRQMGAALGIEVPVEMQTFADRVRRLDSLNTEISKPATSERAAYDALQRQREAIEAFAKETQTTNAFSGAVDELRRIHERAEAAALLALMHPRDSQGQNLPPVETALVKERLARGKPADAVAAKGFAETEKLLNAWESVQATRTDRVADGLAVALRDSRGVWPEWLIKQADAALAKSRGETPPASAPTKAVPSFSTVPLYFFNGLAALKDARFPELEKGLTFSLCASPGANSTPLIDPTRQGTLRVKFSDPALFAVKEADQQITPESAAENLPRPFVLIAKNPGGQDVLQLWVVSESDKPLLSKKSGGLSRTGNTLSLDSAALGLPGAPKSRMTLRVPASATLAGSRVEPLPIKDWAVDLTPLHEEIARFKKETERQTKALEAAVAPPNEADVTARFKELKQVIAGSVNKEITEWAAVERTRIERKENDEKKREPLFKAIEARRNQRLAQAKMDFGDESAPLFKQAGGCIKALCQDATFQGHDALFTTGADLCILDAKADAKALGKAFGAARREVQLAIRNLVTSENLGRYQSGLRALASIITLLSPETPESKTERGKSAAQLTLKQEELRRIAAHPILSGAMPPGIYRLSVLADGVEIPLMEIEIAR